tara:strand:+ start:570 stop:746 length:177 start_codon:yes stop_codon:yes gene_type:complete
MFYDYYTQWSKVRMVVMKAQRIAKDRTARVRRSVIKGIVEGKTKSLYAKLRRMRKKGK